MPQIKQSPATPNHPHEIAGGTALNELLRKSQLKSRHGHKKLDQVLYEKETIYAYMVAIKVSRICIFLCLIFIAHPHGTEAVKIALRAPKWKWLIGQMAKIKELQSAEQQAAVVKVLGYSYKYLWDAQKVAGLSWELNWSWWDCRLGMSQMNAPDCVPSSFPGSSALATKLFSRQPFWTELIKLHWSARFLFIFIHIFLFFVLWGDLRGQGWLTADSCWLNLIDGDKNWKLAKLVMP